MHLFFAEMFRAISSGDVVLEEEFGFGVSRGVERASQAR